MRCLTRSLAALLALRALCAHCKSVADVTRPDATASPPLRSAAPPLRFGDTVPDVPTPLEEGDEVHAVEDDANAPAATRPWAAQPPVRAFGAGAVIGMAVGWLGNNGWRGVKHIRALSAAQRAAANAQWRRAWEYLQHMAYDRENGPTFRRCWEERLRYGGKWFIEDVSV